MTRASRLRLPLVLLRPLIVPLLAGGVLALPSPAAAQLGAPDLSVSISAPATVPVGHALTYTVSVANTALHTQICLRERNGMIICHPLVFGSEADNVTVSVTIPTGFSFNGQPSGGGGFTCNPSTVGIATCTGGTVFSDDTVTITIPVIASSTVGSFTATATVDPSNLIAERDETNNSGSVTLSTVPLPNLLATESATPSPFPTFTPVTYRINVFNLGSGAANNVSISMFTVLPASLVTWTIGGGFTCNAPAGGPQALQINCSGGSLPAFSSATLTIQVKIFNQSTPSGTPFTLFGSLDPQNLIPETNESDNSFTAAAIVQ